MNAKPRKEKAKYRSVFISKSYKNLRSGKAALTVWNLCHSKECLHFILRLLSLCLIILFPACADKGWWSGTVQHLPFRGKGDSHTLISISFQTIHLLPIKLAFNNSSSNNTAESWECQQQGQKCMLIQSSASASWSSFFLTKYALCQQLYLLMWKFPRFCGSGNIHDKTLNVCPKLRKYWTLHIIFSKTYMKMKLWIMNSVLWEINNS